MFGKILVPLDGSELAERALEPAYALSRQAEGSLILLRGVAPEKILVPDMHLFGGYGVIWPDQSLAKCMEEAQAYLETIRKTKAESNVTVRAQALDTDPAEAIVDIAAEEGVDLIVLSSHGYSGLTRWVLGSVAEKVLSIAPCPVLVLRSAMPIRKVLVTLDGSPLSEHALAPGLAAAAGLGAEAAVLRVIEPVGKKEIMYLDGVERGLGQRLVDEIRDESQNYLRDALAKEQWPGLTVKAVVVPGAPAETILNYAETHDIDLIAMSTHGRTGLKRWAYGSVTGKVLRGFGGSMLITRPAAHHLN